MALVAMAVLSGVDLSKPPAADAKAGRPLGVIVRQPRLLAAAVCGVVSYALMNLLMTSAPLAMRLCGLSISDSNLAIQWHVVAMYGPSFFTGALIARFGAMRVVASQLSRMAEAPDKTERRMATDCPHCGTSVAEASQRCRHRYDHIDLPVILPVVTRVELFGGRCGGCGRRYRAEPPVGLSPGTPFGPGIRSLLLYLHHSHHVGFERLSRMLKELFGLTISEGAIANAFRRTRSGLDAARAAIKTKLLTARVIASDETTTRVDGATHWQWVFISDRAVLHEIAPRRAKSVAEQVMGDHRPKVWVSDRYAGQQGLASVHQVCLAHVLRDVQYAIDSGDTVVAPKIRDHLRWAIRVGKRRAGLKDTTLAAYAAKAERRLDALVATPAAHPAGQILQRQIKAWRTKFFVFLADREVPPTNNISEREIRPSVVFRKVTNGFRSDWGAQIHAGYRSVTGTARLKGQAAFDAVRELIDGNFAIA